MHEPHSSGVRRITRFVRVEVVMQQSFAPMKNQYPWTHNGSEVGEFEF